MFLIEITNVLPFEHSISGYIPTGCKIGCHYSVHLLLHYRELQYNVYVHVLVCADALLISPHIENKR